MEFQNVMEARRSMRKYDAQKKVTKEQLTELFAAAQEAPTWKNSQTGRYYCVMTPAAMEEFRVTCLPEFNAKNTKDASAYIVTTFVKNVSGFQPDGETPTNELGNGWGAYDLGLQNENLVLKATELGLATLIMGIRDEAAIRKMCHVPENEAIVSVIGVGYPADAPERKPRLEMEKVVTFF